MRMISFRAPLPALALLLFFLVAYVHADIDTKFERFFRDRHDSNHGGSTVTVRRVTIDCQCMIPWIRSRV